MEIKLSEEDKKAIEKCVFVVQNGRINFPKGANYSIERLEKILKEAKKMKNKKGQIMCGIMIKFPYKLIKKTKPKKNKNGTKR